MKFHIVREGETIKDIMFLYSVNEDELKEDNRHIRKWDRLVPGTKLKISVITKSDDEDIMQMEPFVEDYYPKEVKLDEENEVISNNVLDDDSEEVENDSVLVSNEINEKKEDEKQTEIVETERDSKAEVNLEERKTSKYNGVRRSKYIYYPYYIYYPVYMSNIYPYYVNKNRLR